MSHKKRVWRLFACAILLTVSVMSGSVLSQDGGAAINTDALRLPVSEIRDDVPDRKDDARFGILGQPPKGVVEPGSTPITVRLQAIKAPRVNEAIKVSLQIYAFEDAPGTVAEIELPKGVKVLGGTTHAEMDLVAGQMEEITVCSNSEFGPDGKGKAVPSGSKSAERGAYGFLEVKRGLGCAALLVQDDGERSVWAMRASFWAGGDTRLRNA